MTGAASGFSSRIFSKSIRFLILLLRTLGWAFIVVVETLGVIDGVAVAALVGE